MKSKITIFGSCVSMDNFRSAHNNYKNDFELSLVQLRLSLISVMQEAIDFTEDEIKLLPDTPQHRFSTNVLRNDLRKNYLNLITDDIEYMVLDLYFDLIFGVLYTNRGVITNNTWDYVNTDFYKNLKEKREYSFNENPYEYYVLWTRYCDNFFKYLHENFPNLKIILNKVKIVDVIKDKNGEYYVEPLYTKRAVKLNPLMNMLEGYILSNYDVIYVDLTRDVTSDEKHIWGKSLVHYNIEYYHNFYKVIREIVDGNNSRYFYEKNNEVHSEEKIPNTCKSFNYKLRSIRNSHYTIDKAVLSLKKIFKS